MGRFQDVQRVTSWQLSTAQPYCPREIKLFFRHLFSVCLLSIGLTKKWRHRCLDLNIIEYHAVQTSPTPFTAVHACGPSAIGAEGPKRFTLVSGYRRDEGDLWRTVLTGLSSHRSMSTLSLFLYPSLTRVDRSKSIPRLGVQEPITLISWDATLHNVYSACPPP